MQLITRYEEDKLSQRKLAEELKISKGQVYNILIQKEEILKANAENLDPAAKRLKQRKTTFDTVNQLMSQYWIEIRRRPIAVSGTLLKEKALSFARALGVENFKASEGWLSCFKNRHNIAFKSISGESRDVNMSTVDDWKARLPGLCKDYNIKDIFNADETGLFFRALPNKTLATKGETCHGGKMSKERLSVLFCCSMLGEKLPPLVIGKSKIPAAFRTKLGVCKKTKQFIVPPPVDWQHNSKAWMTEIIWTKWLSDMNSFFERKKRKIILFVDNMSAHVDLKLSNINLQFYPPNCTSVIQPLDQGIIQSFKVLYRKCFVKSLLDKIDNKNDEFSSTIDVLDACYWIKNSWDQVSQTTIINCFNHAGYDVASINYENNADSMAIEQLSELVKIRNNKLKTSPEASISASEYVDIDKNLEPSFRCTSADFENDTEETLEIEENEVERNEVVTKEKFRS